MTTKQRRLVVVDQSLRNFDGHYYEYDLALTQACGRNGLVPVIAAHRGFSSRDVFGVPVMPWFTHSWNEAGRDPVTRVAVGSIARLPPALRRPIILAGSRLKKVLRRVRPAPSEPPTLPLFGAEVFTLLRKLDLSMDEHVLIHTLSNAELHALADTVSRAAAIPHMHVVLRRDAEEADVVSDPWGGVGVALTRLTSCAHGSRVHLYTDTEPLATQYRQLIGGRTIRVLPVPHCLPPRRDRARAPGPLRLVYLGNARSEKGFDLLPDLVAALLETHLRPGRARFVIQSNHSMSIEEATISLARSRLAAYPASLVELVDDVLDVDGFQALLDLADIVLLPYRADLYRRRSSGILVQAAIWGKPVVVPAQTWLADEAPAGAAVPIEDPAHLAAAVANAIETFEAMAQAAVSQADDMRLRHDPVRLIERLLDAALTNPA